MEIRDGYYTAIANHVDMRKSSSNKDMVVVGFEITGGSDGDDSAVGKNISFYGMIDNDKSTRITADRLKVLGFDGEDLFSIVNNSHPVRIKIQNVPPKDANDRGFCRVAGIYSMDGGRDGVNPAARTMSEEEKETAIARISRMLNATESGATDYF